jgi:hypothetical protein
MNPKVDDSRRFGESACSADSIDWIISMNRPLTDAEIKGALINALEKIARLEAELKRVKRAANHAANTASCLANGIIPD